jgi:hypothetical protein
VTKLDIGSENIDYVTGLERERSVGRPITVRFTTFSTKLYLAEKYVEY